MIKYINLKRVSEMTDLSPVTIWRRERENAFPRRRQISKRRVGWLESEVLEWMEARQTV
jgi:prophage regulatory protein